MRTQFLTKERCQAKFLEGHNLWTRPLIGPSSQWLLGPIRGLVQRFCITCMFVRISNVKFQILYQLIVLSSCKASDLKYTTIIWTKYFSIISTNLLDTFISKSLSVHYYYPWNYWWGPQSLFLKAPLPSLHPCQIATPSTGRIGILESIQPAYWMVGGNT